PTSEVALMNPSEVTQARFGAHKTVGKAVLALHNGKSSVPAPIIQLALSPSSSQPQGSTRSALHTHIQIAGVMLLSLTTSVARRFLDKKEGCHSPFDWKTRKVTTLGNPPSDIWRRLHHRARTPRHKETYYKFLFNALPLGARTKHFAAQQMFCHHCSLVPQTMRHFIFSCPLAQAVWQEVRRLFSLRHAVSLHNAAFSWSPNTLVFGRRYGFRLQAGHAVAVHTLWLLYTRAVYHREPAHPQAARASFRAHFLTYLETLWASTHSSQREQLLEDWNPPLRSASTSFPFKLVYNL